MIDSPKKTLCDRCTRTYVVKDCKHPRKIVTNKSDSSVQKQGRVVIGKKCLVNNTMGSNLCDRFPWKKTYMIDAHIDMFNAIFS